jgi:hypothetical protein
MALFYRGAGIGSHWYNNDARVSGFAPHSPGATPSIDRVMYHVARGSTVSPYISFSRSFGIARADGITGKSGFATAARPGYVYEIEISDDKICKLIDPVVEVAASLNRPWENVSYQHDGAQSFLLGVVDPANMLNHLQASVVSPPGSAGTSRAANLSMQVETLVRALRDSEVLVLGNVPASVLRYRYDVH